MVEPNHALRAARERLPSRRVPGAPLSRAELAEAVNAHLWTRTGRRYELDDHLIGKWERGTVRTPSAPYRAALRTVLRIHSDADLGFRIHDTGRRTGALASPAVWSPLQVLDDVLDAAEIELQSTRRGSPRGPAMLAGAGLLGPLAGWLEPPLVPGGPGREFSVEEVEAIEALVEAFRAWRETGLGRAAVTGMVADLTDRLRPMRSGPLTDRVHVATAHLAKIAGSMAFDAGAHQSAQRHYIAAARLAKVGGDVTFGAVALAALARVQYDADAPDDGLAVIHLAGRGARDRATPRLISMLAVREAWGHAQRGDAARFHAAADAALTAHPGGIGDDEPSALAGFDVAELHGTLGARLRDLATRDPRHTCAAVEHIETALRLRDPSRARCRAFDLVSLGRAHLISRDGEAAAARILAALPQLDQGRPGRLMRKVQDWRREAAPLTGCAAVADACAEIVDRLAIYERTL
jgi:hypothetical protein